jgi:hypothetical protein
MKAVLTVGSIAGFAAAFLGFSRMASDIQLLIDIVGLFSGLILLGLATLLHRLDSPSR